MITPAPPSPVSLGKETNVRQGLRSAGRLLWVRPHQPEVSTPPPGLPPSQALWVPDRGEMFLRLQDGPDESRPVLLLHGWTASADTTWFAVYPALAGEHRLVAVDQRGHGRGIRAEQPFSLEACADDAAGLLDVLGIERAIVAGYSMGGAVALLLWQRHRERVAGLVMCATALEWRSTPRERVLWKSLGIFELALRLGTGDGFVQRYLHYAVGHTPEVAQLRAWVGGEFKRGYDRDIAEAGKALSRFDARGFVGDIDVPCASVVTERDRLVRAQEQMALAEALRAPVFAIDADHDAPLVRPKEFSTAVVDAVLSVAEASDR
jgi:3-oxoadipate enol-lactonase